MIVHSVLAFLLLAAPPGARGIERAPAPDAAVTPQPPMVLVVETATGVYGLTTGGADFQYTRNGDEVRVHDAAGNSATLRSDIGCIESQGAGDCRLIQKTPVGASSLGATVETLEPGLRRVALRPDDRLFRPVRVLASVTVPCPGGGTFDLSTGTSSGSCRVAMLNGLVIGGSCTDDNGTPGDPTDDNTAGVDCSVNGGAGSCTGSAGSGSCTQRP